MKTIEQVEEEYSNFHSKSKDVTNLGEFNTYLEIGMDDCDERIKDLEREKRQNKLYELEGKFRNFFFFIFDEEDIDFYEEDNKLLDKFISLQKVYKDYFESVKFIARDYNYKELLKFVDFIVLHYNEQIDYIEYLRDSLEYKYKGVSFYNPNKENNNEVMIQFIYDKMKKFEDDFDKIEGNDTSECIEIRKMKAKWKNEFR